MRAIKKRLVKYKRKDGIDLSFTLYTPPDYKEGTRVPAILYAYPLDYAERRRPRARSAAPSRPSRGCATTGCCCSPATRSSTTPHFRSSATRKKAYDTYLEQLVDDAQAAVDKAVELGVVDRDRIGVTGTATAR